MVSLSEPQNLLFRVCTTLLLPLPYCAILMACFGGSNVAMRVIQHRWPWFGKAPLCRVYLATVMLVQARCDFGTEAPAS
jgi:hypothetical protein